MTIDQMLALAELEQSNIRLGFRSDAVLRYEAQQAAAAVTVEEDDESYLFDALDALDALVWGV